MFRNLLPASWKNHDLSTDGFPGFRYIFSKESFPHINYLVSYIIHELEEQNPCYQISARSLLCSLYIELYRIESLGGVNPGTAKPGSPEILALKERKKEGEIAENSLVISPSLDYQPLLHQASSQILPAFHQVCIHSQTHCTDDSGVLAQCRSHHIL